MKRLLLDLPDEAATTALGAALGRVLAQTAVVYLQGELGAGKSTLARGLLRELGITGAIRSPTYTLLERYPLGDSGAEAWHLDLYRINDVGELEFLGLDALDALWLVEWPERGTGALPAPDLIVQVSVHGGGRRAELDATTDAACQWLRQLACDPACVPFMNIDRNNPLQPSDS